jgi:hypothetical protein
MAAQRQPEPAMRVCMDQAFRECLHIVISNLNEAGEQWTPDAKQDMVSTLFLSAQKMGTLDMWQAPQATPLKLVASAETRGTAPSVLAMPDPAVQNDGASRISAGAAESDDRRSPALSSDDAGLPIGRRAVLEAIARIREELPWPTFHFILKDFGVKEPDELPNQLIAQGCYAVLKQARDHYRERAADPTSFEHFEASL